MAAFSRLSPSGVFAFRPTRSLRKPSNSATWARIAGAWGPILGAARIRLASGDVVVLGGEARRAYHGVDRIIAGSSRLIANVPHPWL